MEGFILNVRVPAWLYNKLVAESAGRGIPVEVLVSRWIECAAAAMEFDVNEHAAHERLTSPLGEDRIHGSLDVDA